MHTIRENFNGSEREREQEALQLYKHHDFHNNSCTIYILNIRRLLKSLIGLFNAMHLLRLNVKSIVRLQLCSLSLNLSLFFNKLGNTKTWNKWSIKMRDIRRKRPEIAFVWNWLHFSSSKCIVKALNTDQFKSAKSYYKSNYYINNFIKLQFNTY